MLNLNPFLKCHTAIEMHPLTRLALVIYSAPGPWTLKVEIYVPNLPCLGGSAVESSPSNHEVSDSIPGTVTLFVHHETIVTCILCTCV